MLKYFALKLLTPHIEKWLTNRAFHLSDVNARAVALKVGVTVEQIRQIETAVAAAAMGRIDRI